MLGIKSASMDKHYYKDEIKQLLMIYTISFIVVSIVLMFIFISIYTNTVVRRNNNRANNDISIHLERELNLYTAFIDELTNSELVINYVKNNEGSAKLFELLYGFNNQREVKSIFYIVDANGETLITNNYEESPYKGIQIFVSGIFKKMKAHDDLAYVNNKVQIDLTKRTIYSLGKSITHEGETIGYIVFDLLEQDISNIINNTSVDILVITDLYNNSILTTNSQILDEIGKLTITKKSDEVIEFNSKDYYFMKNELVDKQLGIYTFSELDLITDLLLMSVIFMLIVMVIIIIIVFYAADYSAKNKTHSINDLIKAIDDVKNGTLTSYVNIHSGDEFQVIGEQFNIMLDELKDQISVINELNERKRVAIIKQLEAQFNPHFIFNTLEILKYLVHIDTEKSTELIVNFASLLRYSIDYEKKHIRLSEDLDYIKSYLLIQKLRYNKRLQYSISYDPILADSIVPKLIMQPIIENCIIHGYKNKEDLNISISVTSRDNNLIMYVEDNGDGISEKRLDEIINNLNSDAIAENSIGLNNIHRRLKLLYGMSYGLSIKSEEYKGTLVVITLPIEKA